MVTTMVTMPSGYKTLLAALTLAGCLVLMSVANSNNGTETGRKGKFLSMFQVVKFENTMCNGSSTNAGTCYTNAECQTKGGQAAGSCAAGYGVCCLFTATCGSTLSENCTYFASRGGEVGACAAKICKLNHNICQLRLDFNTFNIPGPNMSTLANGVFLQGTKLTSNRRNCVSDTFTVLTPGAAAPPVLCGLLSGEHMYVDARSACTTLSFVTSGLSAAQWNIKVTQYSCGYSNLAPTGCTQYFFGQNTGNINTYNYQGGQHLGNQKQRICIRREANQCRICYWLSNPSDFQLSKMAMAVPGTMSKCCGYGMNGMGSSGYDCLLIPSVTYMVVAPSPLPAGPTPLKYSEFCGSSKTFGAFLTLTPNVKTVCSKRVPFSVSFLSDGFEFAMTGITASEATKDQKGFLLHYNMDNLC